jgi:hypothetical protein
MDDALDIISKAVSIVFVIASYFVGRYSSRKKEGKEAGVIAAKIDNIEKNVETLVRHDEERGRQLTEVLSQVARNDEIVKATSNRVDRIEDAICQRGAGE